MTTSQTLSLPKSVNRSDPIGRSRVRSLLLGIPAHRASGARSSRSTVSRVNSGPFPSVSAPQDGISGTAGTTCAVALSGMMVAIAVNSSRVKGMCPLGLVPTLGSVLSVSPDVATTRVPSGR